jgi:hypothetical protein
MLIFDTSLGSMSAPGPHLIHSSYFRICQHVVPRIKVIVGGNWSCGRRFGGVCGGANRTFCNGR